MGSSSHSKTSGIGGLSEKRKPNQLTKHLQGLPFGFGKSIVLFLPRMTASLASVSSLYTRLKPPGLAGFHPPKSAGEKEMGSSAAMAGPKATEGGGGRSWCVPRWLCWMFCGFCHGREMSILCGSFFRILRKVPCAKGILSSKMFETDHGYSPVDIVVSPINGLKARSLLLKYSAPCASI